MKNDLNNSIESSRPNSDEPIIMDASLLALEEKAKNGDIDALLSLTEAFSSGKSAGKNYSVSKKYYEQLFCIFDDENTLGKYYILWNLAVLEADYGNYDGLKERFYQIIDFMVKNIPMEEWKFDVFGWIEECVDWKNDQEDDE